MLAEESFKSVLNLLLLSRAKEKDSKGLVRSWGAAGSQGNFFDLKPLTLLHPSKPFYPQNLLLTFAVCLDKSMLRIIGIVSPRNKKLLIL